MQAHIVALLVSNLKIGDGIMKNKLFCSLVLCYSGLFVAASQTEEATLAEILGQQPIRKGLLPYLSTQDIVNLGDVSQSMREAIEPAILEAAIWESHILNARSLDLHKTREHRENRTFKRYVIRKIKNFAQHNPGRWIILDLSYNNLGNDLEFFRDLLSAIVTTVHRLKIDLASLSLVFNELGSLPDSLFDGLNNLQVLHLDGNQLINLRADLFEGLNKLQRLYFGVYSESLPEHLLGGLNNLEILVLSAPHVQRLPESLFEGLHNLKEIHVFRTLCESLPEHLFAGLNNLQILEIGDGLVHLPEHLFEGLNKLESLYLTRNHLTNLPEGLFKGLANLKGLFLSNNQLTNLPEQLFEGLNNLKVLNLDSNRLESLPEHLFAGLNNLKTLSVKHNQLNTESIRLLQALRHRGVSVEGKK